MTHVRHIARRSSGDPSLDAWFLLAAAYALGASTVRAQAPANPVVAIGDVGPILVVTANGDAYEDNGTNRATWTFRGNVFSAATPAQQSSWGAIKANGH